MTYCRSYIRMQNEAIQEFLTPDLSVRPNLSFAYFLSLFDTLLQLISPDDVFSWKLLLSYLWWRNSYKKPYGILYCKISMWIQCSSTLQDDLYPKIPWSYICRWVITLFHTCYYDITLNVEPGAISYKIGLLSSGEDESLNKFFIILWINLICHSIINITG